SEFGMGELLGKAAAEKLPENAKIVIIEGQAGLSVVVDRTEGIKAGLSTRKDVEILVVQNADWARDKAMNYMEDWLTLYKQIDGVLSHDDVMLLGAVSAIQNAGRAKEFSFLGGIDGLPEGCEAVKAGTTSCSVAQDAPMQAIAAFDMALKTLEGGKQEDVTVETELITKDNVEKWLAIHAASGNM
ncbi:MAG: sugar ABC transporter substrate-binding protein, partial [Oscillospiraceae bacterium]